MLPAKRILGIIAFLTLPFLSYTQSYLDDSKEKVAIRLGKYVRSFRYKQSPIAETDTSITLSIRDTTVQPVDFIYYFNPKGKCYAELYISPCDSCVQKHLTRTLKNKMYHWKQVAAKRYFSSRFWNLLIELNETKAESMMIIRKLDATKKEWDAISNGR